MALTPPSTPPTPIPASPQPNNLSDIFSDSPPSSPTRTSTQSQSDLPRLRSTHTTAGYRNGISASKTRSVQPGFDEGYPLGAAIGLRVGELLGVLEGLSALLRSHSSARSHSFLEEEDRDGERSRVEGSLRDARKELRLESVFGREWWGENGLWTFEVIGHGDGEGEEEATFSEVADAHPLLKRWGEVVEKEMERMRIRRGVFSGEEWDAGRVREEGD